MAHINSTFRLTDSMEIDYIGIDLGDDQVQIYLKQVTYDKNGESVYINHDISIPLDLFSKISDLLPLAIEKAKIDDTKEDWQSFRIYSPWDITRKTEDLKS
jgi:hypothetical protein